MTKTKIVVGAIAALGLTAGGAAAQATDGTGEAAPPAHSIVTPKGKLNIHVGLGVGVSKDFEVVGGAGKPISITPDVFYGVAPKLEVGLAHSGYAITGFWGDSVGGGLIGGGVCVTGEEGGCASVYNGPTGLLARYAVMETADMGIAADVGVLVRQLDSNGSADGGDMLLAAKVGIRGRKMMDKLSIGFAPNISVGLNVRDDAGNKEYLAVPVDVMFAANPKLMVGVQTGIEGPLDEFGDSYSLPVGLGGMYMLNDNMSAGAAFVLHRVAGFEGPDAADLRSLAVFFNWHN